MATATATATATAMATALVTVMAMAMATATATAVGSRGCVVFGIIIIKGGVLDKPRDSSRGLVGVIDRGRTLNGLIVEDMNSGPKNSLVLLLVGLMSSLVLLGLMSGLVLVSSTSGLLLVGYTRGLTSGLLLGG